MSLDSQIRGVKVLGESFPAAEQILTREALDFVVYLQDGFREELENLLQKREEKQAEYDQGKFPDFLEKRPEVKDPCWRVAEAPSDLKKRLVEITGPTDRKMVINALNSGADCYMADFEDSNSPTWKNLLEGQLNLRDAVNKEIELITEKNHYKLGKDLATLLVRPRGWHLPEKHITVDHREISGALFDFGLFFYHNAPKLIEKGSGPYFYLPKLQSHQEAKLWNNVFNVAQDKLKIPYGTIRATVLIETLPAALEMEEILYELQKHSAGLNCGRWDYIFSSIKTFRNHPDRIFPDRSQVTMETPAMKSYVNLLIQTCHKRGAYAMGGMAAQIPLKDPEKNQEALEKVYADKLREVKAGHDGTWVAHPGLVKVARKAFAEVISSENQLANRREDVQVSAAELLKVPAGTKTYEGLKNNLKVGIQYLEAWMEGKGCVPLYDLMEDAATAEISRTQIWQWLKQGTVLEDGRKVDRELYFDALKEVRREIERERRLSKVSQSYSLAEELFNTFSTSKCCEDFLTLKAYRYI